MKGHETVRNAAVFVFIAVVAFATAGSAQSAGTAVRPSFAVDIDAWPFAFGFEGGAWLDHWPWLGGVHVRVGAIRKQYEAQVSRDYGALMGSYGAQIGFAFQLNKVRPFVLLGYERLGTVLFDAEGAGPNGRTQQALTGEVGLRLAATSGIEFLAGVRGSLPIANGPNPLGPPLPVAAAALTILF